MKDFERADPQQIDKLLRLLKDIQNMPAQTQTNTLDTLLQILVAVVCSSAHKPFSALGLELLFKMIRDGK